MKMLDSLSDWPVAKKHEKWIESAKRVRENLQNKIKEKENILIDMENFSIAINKTGEGDWHYDIIGDGIFEEKTDKNLDEILFKLINSSHVNIFKLEKELEK